MSENSKKAAPKATENNDDLLGDAQTPEAKTPETPKKPAAKKGKTADQKKIEAAQNGSDYLPEGNERHLVHVKMEKKVFSPSTGEKLTKDFIQKYNTKEWSAFQKNGGGLGFTCTVLWNPENYK